MVRGCLLLWSVGFMVECHFQQYFSYIGGRNWCPQRKLPICRKSDKLLSHNVVHLAISGIRTVYYHFEQHILWQLIHWWLSINPPCHQYFDYLKKCCHHRKRLVYVIGHIDFRHVFLHKNLVSVSPATKSWLKKRTLPDK